MGHKVTNSNSCNPIIHKLNPRFEKSKGEVHRIASWARASVYQGRGPGFAFDYTHDPKCEKYDGRLIINPGSFTGAYGPLKMEVEPGFGGLEFREKSVEVFFYRIAKKEVVVTKVSWTKGEKMK